MIMEMIIDHVQLDCDDDCDEHLEGSISLQGDYDDSMEMIQGDTGFFFTGPKNFKDGKPRLGESTLT